MCLCGMYNKPVKTKKYIFYPQRGTARLARCPFHDWQYLSMRVAVKTAYTSLRILLVYECNANVVYFQNAAGIRLQSIWATVEYPVLQGKEIIYGIVQQGGVIKFMP